jgi:outer membrane protein TolC
VFYATGNDPNGSRRQVFDQQQTSEGPHVVAIEYYRNPDPDFGMTNVPLQLGTTTGLTEDTINASSGRSSTFGHPEQKFTYALSLTQQLPWGGKLTLTDTTIQQKVYYRSSHYWDDGQFTTNINGALDTPVPFTKGFGTDNPNQVSIRKAEIARARADWELKGLLNDTLGAVDSAFFDLVRRLEALETTLENRELARRLQAQAKRLFDAGESTNLQLAVADAELVKSNVRIEQAFEAYLNASIALGRLIGDPAATKGETIFLPYGYADELKKQAKLNLDQAMTTARANRADFFLSQADLESARQDLALANNQALPDIRFNTSVTASQNGKVYGYGDPIHSHGRIASPDNINHSYAFTYSYPWMNRAADAAVERNTLSVTDRELGSRSTETRVRRELTERMASIQGARARAVHSGREASTLRKTYDSLLRQRDAGLVGEDQLINTSRRLLAADLARIDAFIESKQAESALLVSQGVIARELPAQTTNSALDQRRVQALSDTGQLAFFGSAEKTRKPAP